MPGRTDSMLRFAAAPSNSTAAARSILVITATSALLKMVGYFSGLSSPSVTDMSTRRKIFAKIVGGRTNEIADIFDEEKIEVVEIPAFQGALDHRGFEMAESAGGDLFHGRPAAGEADGVIFRGEIADQRRDAIFGPKKSESFLEKHGLAGAGTRDHADDEDARIVKTLAKRAREEIILLQDVLADFDDARSGTHCSTSSETTSSSFPCTISEASDAAFGAAKPFRASARDARASHAGQ